MTKFVPKSVLGKLSVGLIALFFLTLFFFYLLLASGQRGGKGFFDNLFLAIPALFMAGFGISAFFTGLVSIIKRERAILVFLSSAIGFLILLFILAEIVFPH